MGQLLDTVLGYAQAGKTVATLGVGSVLVELGQLDHIEVKGKIGGLLPYFAPALD